MPVTRNSGPSGSFNNFRAIGHSMSKRVSAVVRAGAFNVNERIQQSFRDAKSGRYYGRHRASAPGEAPAIDYGTLASSYHVVPVDDYHALVASNDEKAPYLEFGTRHLAARPHVYPAAEAERDDFERAVKAALGGGLAGPRGIKL